MGARPSAALSLGWLPDRAGAWCVVGGSIAQIKTGGAVFFFSGTYESV
jgi:hypothetical protein